MPFTKSISLRDAGLQLSPRPGKVAYSTLLSLLKAGQIGAGFRFVYIGVHSWLIRSSCFRDLDVTPKRE